MAITHQRAKQLANDHLRARNSVLRTVGARRSARFGVWSVDYHDPADPDGLIVGGGLVVTDDGDVYDIGSAPGALDDLMIALGRWPSAGPRDRE